jgi:hypothetical protein
MQKYRMALHHRKGIIPAPLEGAAGEFSACFSARRLLARPSLLSPDVASFLGSLLSFALREPTPAADASSDALAACADRVRLLLPCSVAAACSTSLRSFPSLLVDAAPAGAPSGSTSPRLLLRDGFGAGSGTGSGTPLFRPLPDLPSSILHSRAAFAHVHPTGSVR